MSADEDAAALDLRSFAARRRRRAGRGPRRPRPASDDVRPARALAAGQLRLERLPSARTSTSSAPRRARTRATSASSPSPRSATSRRCATSRGASPASRSSSAWSARRSARCAPTSPASRPATGCSGTGCRSTHGRRWSSTRRRRRGHPPLRAPDAGLGLELAQLRGRMRDGRTAPSATACCASSTRPARAWWWRSTIRRRSRCSRSTRARSGSSPRAAAACPSRRDRQAARPRARRPGAAIPPASSSSTISTPSGRLVPVARAPGHEQREHRRRPRAQPDGALPRGHAARRAARRPHALARLAGRAGVPAGDRGARPRRARSACPSSGSPSRGGEDRHGLRHGEHGLGRGGAAPDRHLHPGGRRDQRRRHRHQRRRAAVLERRGHDAHAHARHPRDDAGERDGAHGQAGARLLRRRVGRGQLRHRRLRADHGPERAGAVPRARPGRRVRAPARLLRAHLRRARASASRAARATDDPVDRDVGASPHVAPDTDLATRRRDLLGGDEPRPQEAVRHPLR